MRLIVIILLSLWVAHFQFDTGEYIHERNGFRYSLTINPDSTFDYFRPAVMNGTIKESGKWRINQDNLILIDSVGVFKTESKVEGQTINEQNFVSIKFIDENKEPLNNLEVGLNEDSFYKRTDSRGMVRFEYSELKKRRRNQPKNTVEVIEFKTKGSETTVAVDDIFSNQITVIEDFNPKTVYQQRERKIEIRNGVLLFRNPTGMNEQQEFEFTKRKE